MAGRRSERPGKSISYSKFSSDGNKSNDDDDDFMEPTPPNKKKKKSKKSPETSTTDNKHEPKIKERKSRNRLSDEDKYQQQLEEALKMSLANTEPPKTSSENPDSSQESTNSEQQDTQTSCVVQAEVLASPNTKLLQNSKCNDKVELRKQVIENEAAQSKDDEITLDPIEDNKETGRRKSGRSKKIKEKEEEDDYEMSDESESEDEEVEEEESDESDYEESPKKKPKTKKQPAMKEKKVAAKKVPILKKTSHSNNTVPSAPKISLHCKENRESSKTPVALRKPISSKSSFTPPAISSLPKTPKSSTDFLPRRSPGMMARPGRFIQPGWTPPGPAGSKSDTLKSPQSPNLIRVGLSRNVKLTPLHPRVNIK